MAIPRPPRPILTRLPTNTSRLRRATLPRPFQSPNPTSPRPSHRPLTTSPIMMSTALRTDAVESEAQHIATSAPNGSPKINNWATPGPAAFDFRSDVVTTPTTRMLSAISATTLLDDVFESDPTTNGLEALLASLTGHEAALLVLSGTMGNQVAIRAHLQGPPHSIVGDSRAHIFEYEAGGIASLSGALARPAIPSNNLYLTLEDVQAACDLRDDIHACPTKLISLENTLHGTIMPLAEAQRISAWAREKGIIMHLDGARLWEAVASGAGSLKDYAACFDSMSLCFSKGLGAPIGSIITCTHALRARARWIRKSIGGGVRQGGVISAAARVAVEDTFLGGRLKASHERAKVIEELWVRRGGKVVHPVQTNMVWLDLDRAGCSTERFIEEGKKVGLTLGGGRLVVHYQIGEEAVQKLERVMDVVLPGK